MTWKCLIQLLSEQITGMFSCPLGTNLWLVPKSCATLWAKADALLPRCMQSLWVWCSDMKKIHPKMVGLIRGWPHEILQGSWRDVCILRFLLFRELFSGKGLGMLSTNCPVTYCQRDDITCVMDWMFVPPQKKFRSWNPTPQWDGIRKWSLWGGH